MKSQGVERPCDQGFWRTFRVDAKDGFPGSFLSTCLLVLIIATSGIRAGASSRTLLQGGPSHDRNVQTNAPSCPVVGDEPVTSLLLPVREKFNVPAMAAAVVTSDGLRFAGAVGVRKRGTAVAVGLNDQWHLGSDTKAMTAALIARLVEEGRQNWDTPLSKIFPELAQKLDPNFRRITVLHLLSHKAGLPRNLNFSSYTGDDVLALRKRAGERELARVPRHTPGTEFEYSNLGYIIAGAVVEKVTGHSWEESIRAKILEPLRMTTAHFGGTGTPGQMDHPWPHTSDGKPTARNGPSMDNPPIMGPAGRVHCTIQDWARFIQDQLRGARGDSALLKTESYRKLHTPPFGGEYALGWGVVSREWGGGKVLQHSGDNTMNYANVWIAPRRNFAILVCVNQGGNVAFQASDAAVAALIKIAEKSP